MSKTATKTEKSEKLKVFVKIRPTLENTESASKSSSSSNNVTRKGSFMVENAKKPPIAKKSASSLVARLGVMKPSTDSKAESCLDVSEDSKSIILHKETSGNNTRQHSYTFDGVFNQETTQDDLYSAVIQDTVKSAVDGFNAAVFAYGVSSSGKTHTMHGTKSTPGIIEKAFQDLFSNIEDCTDRQQKMFHVDISYVELHNNHFHNLLSNVTLDSGDDSSILDDGSVTSKLTERRPSGTNLLPMAEKAEKIDIHESSELGVFLSGSTNMRVEVTSADEAMNLVNKGVKNRIVRKSNANTTSSRGHGILTIFIEGRTFTSSELVLSKLHFVDLASADSLSAKKSSGGESPLEKESSIETQNINLSLSALGDVLSMLSSTPSSHGNSRANLTGSNSSSSANVLPRANNDNSSVTSNTTTTTTTPSKKTSKFVPYKNSKLTHYLKDSIGGNSKSVFIVHLRPEFEFHQQASTALTYANWAKGITVKVSKIKYEIGAKLAKEDDPEVERQKQLLEERSKKMELEHRKLVESGRFKPVLAAQSTDDAVVVDENHLFDSEYGSSANLLNQSGNGDGGGSGNNLQELEERIADLEMNNEALSAQLSQQAEVFGEREHELNSAIDDLNKQLQALETAAAAGASASASENRTGAELEYKINCLTTELTSACEKESDCEQEKRRLQSLVLKLEQQRDQLTSTNSSQQAAIEQLQAQSNRDKQAAHQLTTDLNANDAAFTLLQQQHQDLTKRYDEAQQYHMQLQQQQATTLSETIASAKQHEQQLTSQLEASNTNFKQLQQQFDQLQSNSSTTTDSSSTTITTLQQQIVVLQQKLLEQQQLVEAKNKELKHQHDLLKDLQILSDAKCHELETRIDELEQLLGSSRSESKQLKDNNAHLTDEVDQLRQSITTASDAAAAAAVTVDTDTAATELAVLKETIATKDQELTVLTSKVAENLALLQQLQQLKTDQDIKISTMNDEINHLKSQVDANTVSASASAKEAAEVATLRDTVVAKNNELALLTAKVNDNVTLMQQLQQLKTDQDSKIASMAAEMSRLQAQVDAAAASASAANSPKDNSAARSSKHVDHNLQDSGLESTSLKQKIKSLQSEQSALALELRDKRAEVDILKQQIEHLKANNNNLPNNNNTAANNNVNYKGGNNNEMSALLIDKNRSDSSVNLHKAPPGHNSPKSTVIDPEVQKKCCWGFWCSCCFC